jgi:hypothetical protein
LLQAFWLPTLVISCLADDMRRKQLWTKRKSVSDHRWQHISIKRELIYVSDQRRQLVSTNKNKVMDSDDDEVEQQSRRKRQIIPTNIKEGCTTTGYDKRIRELCEEVLDKVCKTVQAAEYRKEIYRRCDTRIQQQCDTVTRQVPRERCRQRNRTECYQNFRVVEDVTFTSECENIVQHVCEEHYHVHVPPPPPPPIGAPLVPYPLPVRKRRSPYPQQLIHDLKHALKAPIPPLIHHKELPSPPGCRTLVTQRCHKGGCVIIKKVIIIINRVKTYDKEGLSQRGSQNTPN